MAVRVKRAYEAPSKADGYRVLVDGIWPRGVSKAALAADEWRRDLAPSTALRKWFAHDPAKWREFKRRYFRELDRRPDAVGRLAALAKRKRITLLFGAKDEECNNALALKEYLDRRLR
jgi:uncharacterized protein YeaO (DUF488 family)